MEKNKKLKIKWKNVALAIILLICALVIVHDILRLTVIGWITGSISGWTFGGFMTFLTSLILAEEIIEYLNEESKKKIYALDKNA